MLAVFRYFKHVLKALVLAVFVLSSPAFACESNEIEYNGECIESKFEITTTNLSANDTFSFKISAKGTFYIDWGDGTTESKTRAYVTSTSTYSHTYTDGGVKTIRLGGLATGYSYSTAAISFASNTKLAGISGSLGAIFPTLGTSQPLFQNTFSGCSNLSGSIPEDLFGRVVNGEYQGINGAPKDEMFAYTFSGCSNLSGSIPENLFGREVNGTYYGINGAPAESMFFYTFNACRNLAGSIPENLFGRVVNGTYYGVNGAPAAYMFYNTFLGCRNLTGSIPENLFGRVVNGTYYGISGAPASSMFDGTFSNCSNLSGSIPEDLFRGINGAPAAYMFNNTFNSCSNLSGSIPEDLFRGINGAPASNMFYGTFTSCGNLSGSIPENLFGRVVNGEYQGINGVPAEHMFHYTFNACSGLTGSIPENLFGREVNGTYYGINGAPASNMFEGTFNGCSSLTGSIPENLFGRVVDGTYYGINGAPAGSMFWGTFYGCENLTGSIPAGLFRGIKGIPVEYMFSSTFQGCRNLGKNEINGISTYYIPPTLFAGIDKNTTVSRLMGNVVYATGLLESCPSGTTQYTTGFEIYFEPNKVSCIPDEDIICPIGYELVSGALSCSECVNADDCPVATQHTCPNGMTGNATHDACIVRTYNITYNNVPNGVTNTNPVSYTTADSNITLVAPTRSGYIFNGWCDTAVNGDDVACSGNIVTTINTTNAADITLYATWVESKFEITTTNLSANDTFSFKISAAGTFYVDWGDGIIDTIIRASVTTGGQAYSHTYTDGGVKTIRLAGLATEYSTLITTAAISFWQNTKLAGISGSLGAIFPTLGDTTGLSGNDSALWAIQPRFYYTFSGCSNLTGSIPENLFGRVVNGTYYGINGAPAESMFFYTFEACSNLTGSIPENLFGRVVNGTYYGINGAPAAGMFIGTFSNCSNLTGSIPENLFGRVVNGTYYGINGAPASGMFYQTFKGCSNLSGSIPENLFGRVVNGIYYGINGAPASSMFYSTFSGCNNLTGSIPENLFGRVVNGTYYGINGAPAESMFFYTFEACSNLTGSIPENLFGRVVNGTYYGINGAPASSMFYQTFYGCRNLTGSIPENLFRGINGAPAEYMFAGTFWACRNLTGSIPEGLFQGINGAPAGYMFHGTFVNCSNLTGSIPENLFGRVVNGTYYGINGAPAERMFYSTFSGCNNLTGSIPENLFGRVVNGIYYGINGAPAISMFRSTFYNCSNLTGSIPENLFGRVVNGTYYGINGAPAETMFYGTFEACSNLTGSIPENLFGRVVNGTYYGINGAPAAGMFSNTFDNCVNLGKNATNGENTYYIPPTLFAGISKDTTASDQMDSVFYRTGLLTACPSGTTQYTTGFESYFGNKVSCINAKEIVCPAGQTLSGTSCTMCFGNCPTEPTIHKCPTGYMSPDHATCSEMMPFEITTTNLSANDTFSFSISAAGTFYVDWGDGDFDMITRTSATNSSTSTTYSHTYTTGGVKTIYLGGLATAYYGSSSVAAISFGGNTKIAGISGSLGAIFPTLGDTAGLVYDYYISLIQPKFYGTFSGCSNLTGSIPENLFGRVVDGTYYGINGAPASSMFSNTFYGCSNLTGSIPENLFGRVVGGVYYGINGAPARSMFNSTFSNCSNLTGSIPEDLFGRVVDGTYYGINGSPAEYMFERTFSGCNNLTGSIPENLFGRVVNGTYYGINGAPAQYMFLGTFESCENLTGSIPENLFGREINGTYYGINGAPAVSMFAVTFSGCSNLTGSIPENLFRGINGAPAASMFYQTFYGCSGLTGSIPENLFGREVNGTYYGIKGVPKYSMFGGTFYGCSNLTGSIPENLFRGINGAPAERMFFQTFYGCSGLGKDAINGSSIYYIPPILFAGISRSTTVGMQMTSVFNGTGLLTSCPSGTTQYTTGFEGYFDSKVSCIPYDDIICPIGYELVSGATSCSACANADDCPAATQHTCPTGYTNTPDFTACIMPNTITYENMTGATLNSPNPVQFYRYNGYWYYKRGDGDWIQTGSNYVTLNNPTKSGSTFRGWCDDAELTSNCSSQYGTKYVYFTENQDITVYAKWEETYNINYELNGGSWYSGSHPSTYTNMSYTTVNARPVKPSYEFVGWCDDAELTQNCSTSRSIGYMNGDITLYAKWKLQERTCDAGYYAYFYSTGSACNQCDTDYYCPGGHYYGSDADANGYAGRFACPNDKPYSKWGASSRDACSMCPNGDAFDSVGYDMNGDGVQTKNECITGWVDAGDYMEFDKCWMKLMYTDEELYERMGDNYYARGYDKPCDYNKAGFVYASCRWNEDNDGYTDCSSAVSVCSDSDMESIVDLSGDEPDVKSMSEVLETELAKKNLNKNNMSAADWDNFFDVNSLPLEFEESIIKYDTCEPEGFKYCLAGTYYSASQQDCVTCPAGSYCEGGLYDTTSGSDEGLETCPGNTFNTETGQTSQSSCIACPAGVSTANNDHTGCSCNDSAFTWNEGKNRCYNSSCDSENEYCCDPGEYLYESEKDPGELYCSDCPSGSYCPGFVVPIADATDGYGAIECEDGYYSSGNASVCTACPTGSTSNQEHTACECPEYYYWDGDQGKCVFDKCPNVPLSNDELTNGYVSASGKPILYSAFDVFEPDSVNKCFRMAVKLATANPSSYSDVFGIALCRYNATENAYSDCTTPVTACNNNDMYQFSQGDIDRKFKYIATASGVESPKDLVFGDNNVGELTDATNCVSCPIDTTESITLGNDFVDLSSLESMYALAYDFDGNGKTQDDCVKMIAQWENLGQGLPTAISYCKYNNGSYFENCATPVPTCTQDALMSLVETNDLMSAFATASGVQSPSDLVFNQHGDNLDSGTDCSLVCPDATQFAPAGVNGTVSVKAAERINSLDNTCVAAYEWYDYNDGTYMMTACKLNEQTGLYDICADTVFRACTSAQANQIDSSSTTTSDVIGYITSGYNTVIGTDANTIKDIPAMAMCPCDSGYEWNSTKYSCEFTTCPQTRITSGAENKWDDGECYSWDRTLLEDITTQEECLRSYEWRNNKCYVSDTNVEITSIKTKFGCEYNLHNYIQGGVILLDLNNDKTGSIDECVMFMMTAGNMQGQGMAERDVKIAGCRYNETTGDYTDCSVSFGVCSFADIQGLAPNAHSEDEMFSAFVRDVRVKSGAADWDTFFGRDFTSATYTTLIDNANGIITPEIVTDNAFSMCCPSGQYMVNDNGVGACTVCPAGSSCSGGVYPMSTTDGITQCGENTYSGEGQSSCNDCPEGSTSGVGATTCQCAPGYALNNDTCELIGCPKNDRYYTANGVAESNARAYGYDDSTCVAGRMFYTGEFPSIDSITNVAFCKYNPSTGHYDGDCTKAYNFCGTDDLEGFNALTQLNAFAAPMLEYLTGANTVEAMDELFVIPTAQTNNLPEYNRCCPEGFVCCASGTYIVQANIGTDNQCATCPAGSYCEGIQWNPATTFESGMTQCLAGTYNTNTGSTSSDACTSCPTGYTTANTGTTDVASCYATCPATPACVDNASGCAYTDPTQSVKYYGEVCGTNITGCNGGYSSTDAAVWTGNNFNQVSYSNVCTLDNETCAPGSTVNWCGVADTWCPTLKAGDLFVHFDNGPVSMVKGIVSCNAYDESATERNFTPTVSGNQCWMKITQFDNMDVATTGWVYKGEYTDADECASGCGRFSMNNPANLGFIQSLIGSMYGNNVCEANTINITWDGVEEPDNASTCTFGKELTTPDYTPSQDGYIFLGWKPTVVTQ